MEVSRTERDLAGRIATLLGHSGPLGSRDLHGHPWRKLPARVFRGTRGLNTYATV